MKNKIEFDMEAAIQALRKNQKAFMADLKCAYKAATLNAAETELDKLEEKWGGDKYPVVITSWLNK